MIFFGMVSLLPVVFVWDKYQNQFYINVHTSERVVQCNTVHIVHTVAIGTVYCVLRSALCTAHCAICWTGCVAIGHHVNSASTEIYPCSVLPGQNPNLLQISNCKLTSLQQFNVRNVQVSVKKGECNFNVGAIWSSAALSTSFNCWLWQKTRPSCLCWFSTPKKNNSTGLFRCFTGASLQNISWRSRKTTLLIFSIVAASWQLSILPSIEAKFANVLQKVPRGML